MSKREKVDERNGRKVVNLCIAGHPVNLSFAEEPDATAAQRVRNCLIDSFIRQDAAKHGAA